MTGGKSENHVRDITGKIDVKHNIWATIAPARVLARFLMGRRMDLHMNRVLPASPHFEPPMYGAAFDVLVTELSILDKEEFQNMQARWGKRR